LPLSRKPRHAVSADARVYASKRAPHWRL
jgi:hypothetical protein